MGGESRILLLFLVFRKEVGLDLFFPKQMQENLKVRKSKGEGPRKPFFVQVPWARNTRSGLGHLCCLEPGHRTAQCTLWATSGVESQDGCAGLQPPKRRPEHWEAGSPADRTGLGWASPETTVCILGDRSVVLSWQGPRGHLLACASSQ